MVEPAPTRAQPFLARVVDLFLRGRLPPLLVVGSAIAGLFAILATAREEERVVLPAERAAPRAQEQPARASEAVAKMRGQLLAALTKALEQGPVAAIDACRIEAPRIAEGVAGATGISVGRTSHRLRNPRNAPEPWMLPLLEEFRAGTPQPGAWRSVDLGPRGTGYVEPIYLQPLCATCHGDAVEASLLEHIRGLYPDDEAVGFRVGDLRGLFWAVVPPAEKP